MLEIKQLTRLQIIRYCEKLEQENKKLKIIIENNDLEQKADWKHIEELEEENRNLKSELDKFSEAYKRYRDYEKEELAESCYDLARENEKLKEKIAKLEFDIEAWKKLKAVREEKIRILNEKIGKLVMKQ